MHLDFFACTPEFGLWLINVSIDRKTQGAALRAQLTNRQAEVLERVAQRKSFKGIASDLGIAESTVNHHVKMLKLAFGVNSLAQLQEIYVSLSTTLTSKTYRKPTSINKRVSVPGNQSEGVAQNGAGPALSFHDSLTYNSPAPWESLREPVIVPGLLNGTSSRWVRAALMVAIAIGLFAAVIVGLGAAQGVTAALKGSGSGPASQS